MGLDRIPLQFVTAVHLCKVARRGVSVRRAHCDAIIVEASTLDRRPSLSAIGADRDTGGAAYVRCTDLSSTYQVSEVTMDISKYSVHVIPSHPSTRVHRGYIRTQFDAEIPLACALPSQPHISCSSGSPAPHITNILHMPSRYLKRMYTGPSTSSLTCRLPHPFVVSFLLSV